MTSLTLPSPPLENGDRKLCTSAEILTIIIVVLGTLQITKSHFRFFYQVTFIVIIMMHDLWQAPSLFDLSRCWEKHKSAFTSKIHNESGVMLYPLGGTG